MAINYFVGWSQKDLEAELRAAQEDLAAGKSLIASRAGDVGTNSQIAESAQNRIKMLLAALNKIDPTNYPVADITAITSSRACFS